ncbi:MAG: alpha-galactosidase [Lentisphaeria bacterium]|nr:alpha-galactosidase [Lentisphaeria bacterium]
MNIDVLFGEHCVQSLEHTGHYSKLTINVPAREGKLMIRFSVPILDMHGFWTPSQRTPSSKIIWVIDSQSAGQRDFPFLSFFNTRQINRFSVGTTDLIDDTQIIAKMNQEKCCYDITITVALQNGCDSFNLILDQRPVLWTEALADWRKALELTLPAFPDAAWEPVFCTWYAVHAAVTQDWVEKNARIAADLGFRTLIIDDGWCFDEMKRVSPQTITSWYEWIGDWNLSTTKFPDFEAHRRRVQAMGMKYLLWVTPFLIGEKSEFKKQYPSCCKPGYHEGCYTFDSHDEEAVRAMLDKLKHVIRDYGLDGLKIDFLDHIFPNIDAPEGRAVTSFIQKLSAAIREVKKNALIEYRQAYATPGMVTYATQFRAGDVPFDFIDNFQRIAQIRISMGDQIPVHADPVYWHPQESSMNISRHMIASLAGVPMLSMDMQTVSKEQQKIVKRWLDFYKEKLDLFKNGKWKMYYYMSNTTALRVTAGKETVIFLMDPARLQEILKESSSDVYVLNLSQENVELPGAEIVNEFGESLTNGMIPPGCSGHRA